MSRVEIQCGIQELNTKTAWPSEGVAAIGRFFAGEMFVTLPVIEV